jgi:hypothetical protein
MRTFLCLKVVMRFETNSQTIRKFRPFKFPLLLHLNSGCEVYIKFCWVVFISVRSAHRNGLNKLYIYLPSPFDSFRLNFDTCKFHVWVLSCPSFFHFSLFYEPLYVNDHWNVYMKPVFVSPLTEFYKTFIQGFYFMLLLFSMGVKLSLSH